LKDKAEDEDPQVDEDKPGVNFIKLFFFVTDDDA
jgi:hypothetical protein